MAEHNGSTPEAESVPSKPGLLENKIVTIGIILAIQAGMALAAAQFIIRPTLIEGQGGVGVSQAGSATAPGEERVRGTMVSLEEMVVSLSSGKRPRYLRTTIALETDDGKTAQQIVERMPEFRDAAILRLSSHTVDDLESYEGKEAVKAEIKDALKGLLPKGDLLNVYFSDFVVQ